MIEKALSRRARLASGANWEVRVEAVSEPVLHGVRTALFQGETHYTERPGILALRTRIAEKLGRDPDAIVVTAGEQEALYVCELASPETPVSLVGDALFGKGLVTHPPETAFVVGSLDALPGLASFRVGFLAAPAALAAGARSWKQALSICTAAPSQRAALCVLERGQS